MLNASLEREIKFSFEGKDYNISFPTVEQEIEIHSRRILYSRGSYKDVIFERTVRSTYLLDIINTISFLSVMCPSLVSDIKGIEDLGQLDQIEIRPLMKAYNKHISPWLSKWYELLLDDGEQNEEDESKQE